MLPHRVLWRALWPKAFLTTYEWQGFLEPETAALNQGSTAEQLCALGTFLRFLARSGGRPKRAACMKTLMGLSSLAVSPRKLWACCVIRREGKSGVPFRTWDLGISMFTLGATDDQSEEENQNALAMKTGIPGSLPCASQPPWEDTSILSFRGGRKGPGRLSGLLSGKNQSVS